MKALINVKKDFQPELGIRSVTVERKSGDVFQYLVAKELVFFFRLIGCIAIIEEKDMTSAESNSIFFNNSTDDEKEKDNDNDFDLDNFNSNPAFMKKFMEKLYKLSSSSEKSGNNESNQETDLLISLISSHEEKSMQNEQIMKDVITSLENILGRETTTTIHTIYNIFRKYNIFKNLYRYKYFRKLYFIKIMDDIIDSIDDFIQAYIELNAFEDTSDSKLSKIYKLMSELSLACYCTRMTDFMFDVYYDFHFEASEMIYRNKYHKKLLEYSSKLNNLKLFWFLGETKKKIDLVLNLSDGQFYGADIIAGTLSYKANQNRHTHPNDCSHFYYAYKKIIPKMKCASFLIINLSNYSYEKMYTYSPLAIYLYPQNLKNWDIGISYRLLQLDRIDFISQTNKLVLSFFQFFEKNEPDMLDHGDLNNIRAIGHDIMDVTIKSFSAPLKKESEVKKIRDSNYIKLFYFFKSFLKKYYRCRNSVIKYLFKDNFETYKYISFYYTTFAYDILYRCSRMAEVYNFDYQKRRIREFTYFESSMNYDHFLRDNLQFNAIRNLYFGHNILESTNLKYSEK